MNEPPLNWPAQNCQINSILQKLLNTWKLSNYIKHIKNFPKIVKTWIGMICASGHSDTLMLFDRLHMIGQVWENEPMWSQKQPDAGQRALMNTIYKMHPSTHFLGQWMHPLTLIFGSEDASVDSKIRVGECIPRPKKHFLDFVNSSIA